MNTPDIDKALIYCRVSSKKQEVEGSGKLSQEHRCRQYAASLGLEVEAVFGDTKTAGGDFMQRPGMVGMIEYLRTHRQTRYLVIFDDLKRFARDTEFHWTLRRTLTKYSALPYCLNFKFEDTAEGRFFETIVAAGGELERHQLGRQAVQKMTARVEQGYFVTRVPMGYRYERTKTEGALLVPNEPFASILREALEGFASGRLESRAEVQRYLENCPEWPRANGGKRKGAINENYVTSMLRHPVYAGLVSAPYWGVSLRKGRHEGLISVETHQRIIERLDGTKRAPARKDMSADFPLRGFVKCTCGTPLTASWPRGRNGHYAYYFCVRKGCENYGKSIKRAKIEGEFEELLGTLTPSPVMVSIATDMFKRGWEGRRKNMTGRVDGLRIKLQETERQIETLLDRVVDAKSQLVAHALEERIERLNTEKLVLAEKIAQGAKPLKGYDQSLRTALIFLGNPCKLWGSDRIEYKRAVLKLTFADHLQYSRNEGFRTPKLSMPFMALADFSGAKKGMVGSTGIEPVTPTVSR